MNDMKPILFNTDMVRALLDGRKTVTRRAVKPQPDGKLVPMYNSSCWPGYFAEEGTPRVVPPPYRPGDILYVRETWAIWSPTYGTVPEIIYKADGYSQSHKMKWRPSIHMPREAARIFLRVTDVQVERLQNINDDDALKEGCGVWDDVDWAVFPREDFERVWNSTIKPAGRALYGWDSNPWVWCVSFERISKEEANRCIK